MAQLNLSSSVRIAASPGIVARCCALQADGLIRRTGSRGAVVRRQGSHERYRLGHVPGIAADRAVHSQAAGGFDACGDQPLNCCNGYFRRVEFAAPLA
jgi:hypothetical protein